VVSSVQSLILLPVNSHVYVDILILFQLIKTSAWRFSQETPKPCVAADIRIWPCMAQRWYLWRHTRSDRVSNERNRINVISCTRGPSPAHGSQERMYLLP